MSKDPERSDVVMLAAEEDKAMTAVAESDPDAKPPTRAQPESRVPTPTLRGRPKSSNEKLRVSVGLIGDHDPTVPAHQAIPLALQRAAESSGIEVGFEWVPTDEITSVARVLQFDGVWCVPASPYRSMEGALLAIRHARENAVPFLVTCGGFQHVVVEYARNVLGWADAEHAETVPSAARAVITPLACALVEATAPVRLFSGTRIASAYGVGETIEGYRCRYGLNPEFRAALLAGPLHAAAEDESGEVRAVELESHPFFVGTLFQPERAALKCEAVPLVVAFVRACATRITRALSHCQDDHSKPQGNP